MIYVVKDAQTLNDQRYAKLSIMVCANNEHSGEYVHTHSQSLHCPPVCIIALDVNLTRKTGRVAQLVPRLYTFIQRKNGDATKQLFV